MGLREEKKQATREHILAIAESMLEALDFEQLTIDDLAQAAGISRKTFFNYFNNKSAILEALAIKWLANRSFWAEDELIGNAEDALVPTNIGEISDWIEKHKRLLIMLEKHTQVFSYTEQGNNQELDLFAPGRSYRIERIEKAQLQGLIRNDIPAWQISRMYDCLRLDSVRYWLQQTDNSAQFSSYYQALKSALLQGVSRK
ncbi:TetR/AcrR family transcriptional regulator [uncultured Pseudoteredinibacter sp.]|uniref:TetR/AcrR family transcriptional regulator n=1 Tax=uncultured Pseudoteredinibacter sp. TaxID=1641701 RepID=UPI002615A280|nr:TetR/AcrR family transcriptional regulator [uncultured Pseudoteredinibacter sp.]